MQNQIIDPVGFRIVYFTQFDIALTSLVGVTIDSYPAAWGNYFNLANPDNKPYSTIRDLMGGPRVVNMWAENYSYLFKKGIIKDKIRVLVFGTAPKWVAFVEDDNVPQGFTTPFLYPVGGYSTYINAVSAYSKLKDYTEYRNALTA